MGGGDAPTHRRRTNPDKGLDPGIGTSACHLDTAEQKCQFRLLYLFDDGIRDVDDHVNCRSLCKIVFPL